MSQLRNVKKEEILEFNYRVGEEYFDQHEGILYEHVMLGFLIAKCPQRSIELLRYLNDTRDWGLLDLAKFFAGDAWDDEVGYAEFVNLFVECINSTEAARERVIASLSCN